MSSSGILAALDSPPTAAADFKEHYYRITITLVSTHIYLFSQEIHEMFLFSAVENGHIFLVCFIAYPMWLIFKPFFEPEGGVSNSEEN